MSQLTSHTQQNCHVGACTCYSWRMSDLVVYYYIYFTSYYFCKAQGFVVCSFYSQLGKRKGGIAAKKDINLQNLILWTLFCNQRAGIPCSANCPTSSLSHQAVLLTLVIYWDSHDSARLFLCGFGGGFENRVRGTKQEGGKLKPLMHHFGGPCALQGGFGVGRASWALGALPALSTKCRWTHVATLVGSVTKDMGTRMAVEADMWNRWWGTGSTKKDSRPPSTHTYHRVLALAGKWERF